MCGCLFIVSGPTGVGKTTLVNYFIDKKGDEYNVRRCVTFTTRKPREGEIDGVDYHFISDKEFVERVERGFFLEWSDQYTNKYGTPGNILDDLEHGRSYILVIDRVGARKIVERYTDINIVTVLVEVSSVDVLIERLHSRDSEDRESRESRLRVSFQEMKQEEQEKLYQNIVLNDVLEDGFEGLNSLFKHFFSDCEKKLKKM